MIHNDSGPCDYLTEPVLCLLLEHLNLFGQNEINKNQEKSKLSSKCKTNKVFLDLENTDQSIHNSSTQ